MKHNFATTLKVENFAGTKFRGFRGFRGQPRKIGYLILKKIFQIGYQTNLIPPKTFLEDFLFLKDILR